MLDEVALPVAEELPGIPFAYEFTIDGQTVRLEAPTLKGLLDLLKLNGIDTTEEPSGVHANGDR